MITCIVEVVFDIDNERFWYNLFTKENDDKTIGVKGNEPEYEPLMDFFTEPKVNVDTLSVLVTDVRNKLNINGELLFLIHLNPSESISHELQGIQIGESSQKVYFSFCTSAYVEDTKLDRIMIKENAGFEYLQNEFLKKYKRRSSVLIEKATKSSEDFTSKPEFEEEDKSNQFYTIKKASLAPTEKLHKFSYDEPSEELKPVIFELPESFDIYNLRGIYDPRYLFQDSCIWFRFGGEFEIENKVFALKEDRLKMLEKCFERDNKWFGYDGAIDFKNFQIRLYNDSYITLDKGRHGSEITPFKFYSESIMAIRKMNRYQQLVEVCQSKYQFEFNILLIDDHACADLNGPGTSKLHRIHELINDVYKQDVSLTEELDQERDYKILLHKKDNAEIVLNIKCYIQFPQYTSSKQDDEELVSLLNWADVILLDYIFRDINDDRRSKKADLFLEDLHKGKLAHEIIKPVTIIPISAYNRAFVDKIRMSGNLKVSRHLILFDGADPICEPELFVKILFDVLYNCLDNHLTEDQQSLSSILDELCNSQSYEKLQKRFEILQADLFGFLQKLKMLIISPTSLEMSVISQFYMMHDNSRLPSKTDCDILYEAIYLLCNDRYLHEEKLQNILDNTSSGHMEEWLTKLINISL